MLASSKLNSIESKISEALINNKISHEGFTTIFNEEKSYRELKESVKMMKNQKCDTEKIIWLKKVKEKAFIKLLRKMHQYKKCYHIVSSVKKYGKYKSKSFKS